MNKRRAKLLGDLCSVLLYEVLDNVEDTVEKFQGIHLPFTESPLIKYRLLCSHMNLCFQNLVTGELSITDIFRRLHEQLPDESPLCFLHIIKLVGDYFITVDLEELDRYSTALDLFMKYFLERPPHQCPNFKFAEAHLQDPSPIWDVGI
eukprot:TRINITY_DN2971_c0_g1_i1.p1 TRINITY_DN2971_c0_g1~~TRINITY_DN2971_c0_g1_i1.p1  ORF type:complete len:149 (-),score=12.61 TRINITY_DN2971_c0_g1_i1:141-587(-)